MTDEIPAFDLYAELEVSERASAETIQAAYRSLQRRHHPDLVGADAGARAVRLNVARDWLTDPDRRARYDMELAVLRQRAPAGVGAAGGARATGDAGASGADARDWTVDPDAEADRADAEADVGTEDDDISGAHDRSPGSPRSRAIEGLPIRFGLDPGRLVRVWIVGLAFLGAVDLDGVLGGSAAVRVVAAVAALVVLLGLTARRVRTDPDAALLERLVRTGWSAIGWLGLGLLAVAGVTAVGAGAARAEATASGPVLLATAIVSLSALRRRPPEPTTVAEFLAMTPAQFEIAVGQVLARHGYRLHHTGGPGDLVADLAGTDAKGRAVIVQCKRYAPGHPVGSRDVQLLVAMGMRHHGAERLVLVTTSAFTDPAVDLADEQDVTLIDGDQLVELMA